MLPLTPGAPGAPLSILCLGAHCDDIEIGAGGSLLRLLSERPRSSVHWAIFSSTPEREQEARGSAADFLAGAGRAQVEVHAFRESFFPSAGAGIKEEFEKLKRALKPDLVFTHRTDDLHQDHRTVGELTWNTFRDHLIAEYEIPKYEGDLGRPNLYVPLPRALALRKIELLQKHYRTQAARAWFKAENFEALLRLRAIECNAPDGFAEGLYARKLAL
jgi:LmbE family N-acetylglucosaminyl deacetylase